MGKAVTTVGNEERQGVGGCIVGKTGNTFKGNTWSEADGVKSFKT